MNGSASTATTPPSASPSTPPKQLGDVVFVEVPAAGKVVTRGGEAAVVESVKAASDVYAPVGGDVSEANAALEADALEGQRRSGRRRLVLQAEGVDKGEFDKLMDADAYKKFLDTL